MEVLVHCGLESASFEVGRGWEDGSGFHGSEDREMGTRPTWGYSR